MSDYITPDKFRQEVEEVSEKMRDSAKIPLTDDELREIEARAEAATPGPWIHWWNDPTAHYIRSDSRATDGSQQVAENLTFNDALFASEARTDIPRLVATVRELREERDQLRNSIAKGVSDLKQITFEYHRMKAERDKLTRRLAEAEKGE